MKEIENPKADQPEDIYQYLLNMFGEQNELILRAPESEVVINKRYDEFDEKYITYLEAKLEFQYGCTTLLIDPEGIFYGWAVPHNLFKGVHSSSVWLADLRQPGHKMQFTKSIMNFLKQHPQDT